MRAMRWAIDVTHLHHILNVLRGHLPLYLKLGIVDILVLRARTETFVSAHAEGSHSMRGSPP